MPEVDGEILSSFCCPRMDDEWMIVQSKTMTIGVKYLLIAKHFEFDIRTTSL